MYGNFEGFARNNAFFGVVIFLDPCYMSTLDLPPTQDASHQQDYCIIFLVGDLNY